MVDETTNAAKVDTDLDKFIRRRQASVPEERVGQQAANELARMWAESDRRFQVRRRLEIAAEWYRWHMHLCEVFRKRAAVHEAKALAFLEANDEGGNAA